MELVFNAAIFDRMPTLDPRIDAYIAQSADFAKPILAHIREVIHAACPQVEETMKWSRPHFLYKGMLCGMSAFKEHCALGFWKGTLLFPELEKESMGHYGRITSVRDLPPRKELAADIKRAMQLNEGDVKVARPSRSSAPREVEVPAYFAAALKNDRKALATFEKGSPSFKREYVMWIADAKTEATRERRMAQAIEWLAEGKGRNWKYEKC